MGIFSKQTKNTNEKVTFTHEKLSEQAVDNFALSCAGSENAFMTYTFSKPQENGTSKVTLDAAKFATNSEYFQYLLGQTYPAHLQESKHIDFNYLSILSDNGKPVPWTKNYKFLAQFATMGKKMGLLTLNNQMEKRKNLNYCSSRRSCYYT